MAVPLNPRGCNAHLDTPHRDVPSSDAARPMTERSAPALMMLLASGARYALSELAERVGASRERVSQQIAVLRAAGLEIESDVAGCRLVHPVDWLHPATVVSRLPAVIRRRIGTVENAWRVDSTSSECQRRAADLPDRSFLFADWQESGRGRRGRRWVSPPAANLQCSCFKRFSRGYAPLSGLPLTVGVAVAEALEDCGARNVGLKWPNDLVHDSGKLGGILVEVGGNPVAACHAIIGVGINVRIPDSVRRELGRRCADLRSLTGARIPSRNALASALIARLVDTLDTFADRGFLAFADAWARRDVLVGRAIRVEGAGQAFQGVAAGVDARGALRVRCDEGVRVIDSADVTVRPT